MTTLQKKNLNIWMNRLFAWILIGLSCFLLGGQAYAAEIQMGSGGMLVFEPCELTVAVGESVTFVNNELPPHNVMFDEPYQEMSHSDLAFTAGESFEVVFDTAGDYHFQCDPHAGAGMKGVIHVE
tara:strand:- start:71 stop:445 length:375 start_codon:yes stop_codon:yes gene_type:complete